MFGLGGIEPGRGLVEQQQARRLRHPGPRTSSMRFWIP